MRGIVVGCHCYLDLLTEVVGTCVGKGRVCECLSGRGVYGETRALYWA